MGIQNFIVPILFIAISLTSRRWVRWIAPFGEMATKLETVGQATTNIGKFSGSMHDFANSGPANAKLVCWIKCGEIHERMNDGLADILKICIAWFGVHLFMAIVGAGHSESKPEGAEAPPQEGIILSGLEALTSTPAVEIVILFFFVYSLVQIKQDWEFVAKDMRGS